MATGRSNKIVGQTSEYLAAAELSRRGLIATTFTGNVPHYDIIASDERGRHVSVQVKSSRGSSWQFGDIRKFFEISFEGHQQVIGERMPCPVRGLVVVFVKIEQDGRDRYYILTWQRLRDLLKKQHVAYLHKHDGIRPRKWKSMHSAIAEQTLKPYLDKWEIIEKSLK